MSYITIFFMAVGLSLDSFSVAVSSGLLLKNRKVSSSLKIAVIFGGFQGVMPIFGWFLGKNFQQYISDFDHWIAFGLLTLIGGKMMYESRKTSSEKKEDICQKTPILCALGFATSIDAFAVGLSLSFLGIPIMQPAIIIGTVTFIFSFLGVSIGKKIGHFFEHALLFLGGMVLVFIGIKILIEHLYFP